MQELESVKLRANVESLAITAGALRRDEAYCFDADALVNFAWACRHSTEDFRDNCEVCHGERGGVPGNENIVGGKQMCDYCSAESRVKSERPVGGHVTRWFATPDNARSTILTISLIGGAVGFCLVLAGAWAGL